MSGTGANGRGVVWPAVWLLLVVVVSMPALGAEPAAGGTQEAASEGLHVTVIGASVSAGFGSGVPLAAVLEAAIDGPKTVTDLSDVMFFLDPLGRTEQIAEKLDEAAPDLVIGLDFLFWFAYGDKSAAARKADLHKGLEFLEKLECPVVVGDLPKFAPSFMLGAEQIPSADELKALNAVIVEWAKQHKHVTVYPLAALVEAIRSGKAVTVKGEERTLKASEVFAVDRLHVTKQGLVTVTVMILETLSQEGAPLAGKKLILDPDSLAEKLKPEEAAAPAEE